MVAKNKDTDNYIHALLLRGNSCEHYATMYFNISVVYNDSKFTEFSAGKYSSCSSYLVRVQRSGFPA